MKKITDSAVFNQVIKNDAVKQSIKEMSIERDAVNLKDLEEPLGIINKRMLYPSKGNINEALRDGQIVLINNPTLKLPKYLNTVGKISGHGIVSVVDISNFAHVAKETGMIDIYPRTLFALCQNGFVLNELLNNWNKVTTNIGIVKHSSFIYSKLLGKIMDKLFAINIDKMKSDTVYYLLAKFFLVNMCGRMDNDTTDSIAYFSCFNGTKLEYIKQEEIALGENIYTDIFSFFDALSSLKGMFDLNARTFVENWARLYGESTILALDYLPYFLATIFSVATSGNIAKDYIIESIVGKNINSVYNEFCKIV